MTTKYVVKKFMKTLSKIDFEPYENVLSKFVSPGSFVGRNMLPLTAIGIFAPYVIYETYDSWKNQIDVGINKTSKDYSSYNAVSGANIEDKIKIHSYVDPITNAKIRRLAQRADLRLAMV